MSIESIKYGILVYITFPVVGSSGDLAPYSVSHVTITPSPIFRLVDGVNVTTCDSHMWLAPYTPGGDHMITITLATPTLISGIQIWNYNKSTEDTSRGVSVV